MIWRGLVMAARISSIPSGALVVQIPTRKVGWRAQFVSVTQRASPDDLDHALTRARMASWPHMPRRKRLSRRRLQAFSKSLFK